MLFGLACEGVTDQVVLQNILCGYFENPDLDEKITYLQPTFDETDQKQGEGGWRMLLKYLASSYFRTAVLNTEFIVLQIDSDISEELLVNSTDNQGNEIAIEDLIQTISDKLIGSINQGESEFYTTYANKIIFAICVHSLECWLVAHYAEQSAIHNCFDVLKTVNKNTIRVAKKPKNYNQLSTPFLIRENINAVANKDPSFRIFIQSLEQIEPMITALNAIAR